MADLMSMIAGARSTATEVSVVQAADALNRGEVRVVVDVREPGEFREEHIPDAVNIPRGLLELRADPASPVADPTLSGAVTAAPNGNGWYNGDVTVKWTAGDALSGIDGSTPAATRVRRSRAVPGRLAGPRCAHRPPRTYP